MRYVSGYHPLRIQGFTLVELSIVLVVIGLLVGGVLAGRDLIRAAEIKSVISDLDKIQTAVNVFYNKYHCLPGDCANATDYGFTNSGDGDELVILNEQFYFFENLYEAELITNRDSKGTGYYLTRLNKCSILIYGNFAVYGHDWHTHNTLLLADNIGAAPWWGSCISGNDALNIDSKIDDGRAGTGNVLGVVYPWGEPFADCTTVDPWGTSKQSDYVMQDEPACMLTIKLSH